MLLLMVPADVTTALLGGNSSLYGDKAREKLIYGIVQYPLSNRVSDRRFEIDLSMMMTITSNLL